jgi:hypothetical protein
VAKVNDLREEERGNFGWRGYGKENDSPREKERKRTLPAFSYPLISPSFSVRCVLKYKTPSLLKREGVLYK